MASFRYFVFSLGVISSWRRAITPGEKTKERNNEMAQTSHNSLLSYIIIFDVSIEGEWVYVILCFELFPRQRSHAISLDMFVRYGVTMLIFK